MAIMFLDLRGFSVAAANLAPAEVIALLQEYQSRFVPIVEAAGGSVDKFLGDGILVSFGAGERRARSRRTRSRRARPDQGQRRMGRGARARAARHRSASPSR